MLFKSYKDWRQYLRDSGYVNGPINEREYHFLLDQGVPAGQLNEMWVTFLRDLGYSGTISSMAKSWENGDFLTASFSASITGLTDGEARIETELTGNISNLVGGESIVHVWELNGVPIPGAILSTYTTLLGQDADNIRYAPTVDGEPARPSTTYQIRRAPATAGTFTAADIVFNSGVTSIDVRTGFAGLTDLGGSFFLNAAVTGATINGTDLDVNSATVADGATPGIVFTDKYGRNVGPVVQTINIDPVVISASVSPAIQAVTAGNTLADTLLASATNIANYSSNASGTIASAIPSWTIDGGSPVTDDTTVVSESEVIVASVTVTDGEGNTEVFAAGSDTVGAAITVLHVSPTGDDATGDGLIGNPYLTPEAALAVASPGNKVALRPGVYAPFEVSVSGTSGSPITIGTLPGEEQLAIIRGELDDHTAQGGAGSTLPTDQRDGIRIDSQDWLIIEDLTIEKVWRHGVFVVGTVSEQHGHHIIRDNLVQSVGRAAIHICGQNVPDAVIPDTETTSLRTVDVLVQNNEITLTNLEIDIQGFGNVEAISAVASVASMVSRLNHIYDTRQYGIDYKAGVNDSYTVVAGDVTEAWGGRNVIEDNLIERTDRHGIYCDAGRRFVQGVTIQRNRIYECNFGFVLARENGIGANAFLLLDDIIFQNNVIDDSVQGGIYGQDHPGDDEASGAITNIVIRNNTVNNSARDGTSRDMRIDFDATTYAGATVTGNSITGNLFNNSTADIDMDLGGISGAAWTVAENLNVADGVNTPIVPLFTNEATRDFTLQVGSPAVNIVTPTGLPTDYNDVARTGQDEADAGAFETRRASPTVVQVGGQLQIFDNDGSEFIIDATENDYDGPYSVSPAVLSANGGTPYVFVDVALEDDGTPDVGETLTIRPALVGYDPDLGAMVRTYISSGTNAVVGGDTDTPTLLVDALDAGTNITVTERNTQSGNITDSVSNLVTIPAAAPSLTVTSLGLYADEPVTASTTATFTVDLSAYGSGDTVIFTFGVGQEATAATVGGVAATLELYSGGNAQGRVTAFSYVLPGAGSATTDFVITQANATNTNYLGVAVVEGATAVDAVDAVYSGSGATVAGTVLPVNTPYALVAMAIGSDAVFSGTQSWSANVTQTDYDEPIGTFGFAGAIATGLSTDPVSSQTVTFTKDAAAGTSRSGLAVFAVS